MKKILIFILLFSFINTAFGQDTSKDIKDEATQKIEKTLKQEQQKSETGKKIEDIGGMSAFTRIIIGVIQLLLTIILGLLVVFISFKLLIKFTRQIDEEEELLKNNKAVGILMGSSLLGIVILVKRSLYPVFSVLQNLAITPKVTFGLFIETFLYSLGYIFLSLIIAIIILASSIKIFETLTRKFKELKEIQNNNVAVAIYFAGVVISLCYFIEEGLHSLLITLVPGPQVNIL